MQGAVLAVCRESGEEEGEGEGEGEGEEQGARSLIHRRAVSAENSSRSIREQGVKVVRRWQKRRRLCVGAWAGEARRAWDRAT